MSKVVEVRDAANEQFLIYFANGECELWQQGKFSHRIANPEREREVSCRVWKKKRKKR